MDNARELGIDLSTTDAVILSHGHYNHVGGLMHVVKEAPSAAIHFHPASREQKFHVYPSGVVRVSSAFWEDGGESLPNPLRPGTRCAEIADRVMLTGEIARLSSFEPDERDFVLDRDAQRIDPIRDDQAVFFDAADGIVLILGCAHSGVVNTMRSVKNLLPDRPFLAVMGGMHLLHADSARIEKTIEAFRELDVQRIGPCHCTGHLATIALWNAFPDRCFLCPVGTTMTFSI